VQRLLLGFCGCAGALLACSVYDELPGDAFTGGRTGAEVMPERGGGGVGGSGSVVKDQTGGTSSPVMLPSDPPPRDTMAMAGAPEMAGAAGADPGEPSPDACPDDPDKTAPGVCGCGVPDVATATLSDCQSLKAALSHRYDFEGNGTLVKDRVGSADGTIVGETTLSTMDGKGVLLLSGGTEGPYVDLPNGMISSLTDVTVEAWVTWGGGSAWQRVFDFGDTTDAMPENNPASGKTYLFVTPKNDQGVAIGSFSTNGYTRGADTQVKAGASLGSALSHLALVADDSGDKLKLYIDGVKVADQGWVGHLSQINDVNVWLGRSQYSGDPEFAGVFHEFRIYKAALTDAQIKSSFTAGSDPSFLAY